MLTKRTLLSIAAGALALTEGVIDEAIELLEDFGVVAGDAVLVKGSNSVGLGRLVDHFIRAR